MNIPCDDDCARNKAAELLRQLPGSDEHAEHDVTETAEIIQCEHGRFVQAWIWIADEHDS